MKGFSLIALILFVCILMARVESQEWASNWIQKQASNILNFSREFSFGAPAQSGAVQAGNAQESAPYNNQPDSFDDNDGNLDGVDIL